MTATHTSHEVKLKPRTKDVLIEENLEFRGLFLSANIQEGLTKHGFVRPSPIQLKAIPLGRCGLDLIIQAKSGTGKTCVFSVIALDGILLDSLGTQVLVLAPTREIAVQICEVVNNIGCCMAGLKCLTFIGGTPLSEDRLKLARCHIAIGTPGRIKQLIEEKLLKTSNIRLFVLDEADKLLEDSFQEQVNWVFSSLPENKQMLALSATYPEVLAQHLTAYMRNPTFLRLNITDPALLGIRQYYRSVSYNPLVNKLFDSKTDALLELLSSVEFHQCLIFSNYQMRAESLSEVLNFRGWPATYISGSREQEDRMAAMKSLKQMTCRVLISTDLTSRGIDAENVNLVVNLDLPPNHETYLHRIGRAGRFGTYGAGVSFVSEGKEMDEMHRLEKLCHTTVKPLPDPIPCDLARSSGFVSLEHLVTTETIITKKEAVTILPTKPLLISPTKPQSEATILGKSRLSESASDVDGSKESGSNGNIPKESGSHGDGPKESGSNGDGPKESGSNGDGPKELGSNGDGPKESGSNGDGPKESGSNGDGPKESGSNGDGPKESGSNGDCPKESGSNGDVPNESGSNGGGPKKSGSNRDSYSEADRSHVVVTASMVTGVNENGKCESDNVSGCKNASIQSSEGKTRRKVNNVWTSLSFIYGAECKDMEDKRAKGTLVNATAKDQHRKSSPRKSTSGSKSAEHKQGSQNAASSGVAVVDRTVGKGDTDPGVPLAALKNAGARTTVPTLPSLRAFTGPSATLPTYADLLADYDDYMADDVCDQEFLTQKVDQEATFDTNYTDYLNGVYKLLQDLAEHVKVQERTQVKPLGNGDAVAEFVEVAQALVGHHEELLAVCATHKTEGLRLGDVEPTKEANEGMQSKDCEKKRSDSGHSLRQLTSEQMLRNYAMLRDERLCTQADFQEKEQKKSDMVDTGVKLSQFAKNSKPTWSKRKKYASPYGPWQPYIPPEFESKEETDVDEQKDTDEDDTDELDGDEESETDWESSSLDDVDLGKEPCSISSRRQSSRNPPSGSSRHPFRSTDQGHGPKPPMGQGFYPPPTTHDFYAHPLAYGYYPPSPSAYGHYPPPPSAYGHYPPPPSAYGHYPPPPSAYGQYPPPPSADGQPTSPPLSAHAHYTPPWSTHAYHPSSGEVPSAPDMAFQNMMHAQQNMLFATTCYHQYMMHLQQADYFKRMLQSQHALSNTDSLYREQERYIRKMAKWMAQSKK